VSIEFKDIYKSFGTNQVLKGVSFTVEDGEICALIGENGAGKSTLMNILGGVIKKDSGDIFIDGKKVDFNKPIEAIDCGIAFIHQELNLINDLPIYENMFIGREIKNRNRLLNHKEMLDQTKKIFEDMNINLNPKTMVSDLDVSYKQIVEIARAMMMNARTIIMDEPTTSLTEKEIKRVFEMMLHLKKRNVSIIYISHKLNEIKEICDRYYCLRDGNLVSKGLVSDVSTDDLATFMVGHEFNIKESKKDFVKGEEIFRVENYSKSNIFNDISFKLHKGEILGFTGLLGDGRSELFRSIFGIDKADHGSIFMDKHQINIDNVVDAIDKGIGYLPKNRKENGIIKDMNILENATIVVWPKYAKYGFIDIKLHKKIFREQVKSLRIKLIDETENINNLSGGNQQKVILAKWLATNPKVMILDNPTQGVDVGAKEDIYEIIKNLADHGMGIIILSSEAQEIVRICDRAIVMYHGKIQGEVFKDSLNEHNIMKLATGGNIKSEVG